ncbi:MAG: glycosyltransferase, partial [Ilumatobacter sp.]
MATSSDGARPRIVHLLTSDISSVLVRGQLGFMVERGFDVTVGVACTGPVGGSSAPGWGAGVCVEHVPFVREMSVFRDLRALVATIRLLRRVRPDIVNASTPKAGLLGTVAARLCRVRVRVYVIRGLRFETASGWQRRILRGTEWVAVRCATHVVANSESVLWAARDEGVVPSGVGEVIGAGSGNGVDVEWFTPSTPAERVAARASLGLDGTVIAFVGRLTKDKGVADLVDVFTTRFDGRDDVSLLLVGDFESADPLDAVTRRAIDSDERIHHVT